MLNTIDLFAGCGGLTEGFKQANKYKLLAGIEWDINAVNTLRKRLIEKWEYKEANKSILHFDIQRTDELINGFMDNDYGSSVGLSKLVGDKPLDVIIGGPPCQAYSVAGRIRDTNGMHEDYRNYLFESYMSIVEHFKPKACIFENVPGMLSATPGGIPIIDRISKAFNDAGYTISVNLKKEAMFDLSEFGVPQKRKRIIIVAFRNKAFDNANKKVAEFYRNLNSYKVSKINTAGNALSNLPKIHPKEAVERKKSHYIDHTGFNSQITDHEPRFHNERDIEIFQLLAKDIESGECKYTSSKALLELYTEKTGKTSSVHKYHVIRGNLPSNTIPAHLYKDGLRHIHPDPEQARSITVREAARLQSFPDDFIFCGANGAKYKMIGNAVPPQFAKHIALSLASTLSK
jgi:DNA (cytosine-5)-methyltransferase 1